LPQVLLVRESLEALAKPRPDVVGHLQRVCSARRHAGERTPPNKTTSVLFIGHHGEMRADRLLRILLLMQTRGRVTASDLATELEGSVRAVQRDMEALGAAGVPVFATRGGDGGWELLASFRTKLTGMTAAEALAVVVGRPASVLADLGLHEPGEAGL